MAELVDNDKMGLCDQLCVFNEIFVDDVNNEVICTLSFMECPMVINQTRLQIARYHIALLVNIMDHNSGESLEEKIINSRPLLGVGAKTSTTGKKAKSGLRLNRDEYNIVKQMIHIKCDNKHIANDTATDNVQDNCSGKCKDNGKNKGKYSKKNVGRDSEEDMSNIVVDSVVMKIDNEVVVELNSRLDNKYKTVIFRYGQTIIVDFFRFNKSTYDLITCLTVKLLMHPKLAERLNTILKNRPVYMKSICAGGGKSLYINNNSKYLVSNIVVKIQEFVVMLRAAFEDNGVPDLEMLEAEMYLHCGISYDLMYEAVVNFNQFQLSDMDTMKLLDLKVGEDGVVNKVIKKHMNKVKIFSVKYSNQELSDSFDGGSNLLFHGSPMINWHSLLYNGPYVPAKTSGLIDNGAAYGIGVYLSPDANLSINYTGYRANYVGRGVAKSGTDDIIEIDKYGNNMVMMGIFQVRGDMSRYKKNTSIYVCPDTDQICLKYLVYGSYNDIKQLTSQLNKFISDGAGVIVKDSKNKQVKRGAKRLMGEIRQMTQRDGKLGDDGLMFNFSIVDDCINVWRIVLPITANFCNTDHKPESDKQPAIYKDACKYKIENLVLEIKFPENYPFAPPFVRIVYPRFEFRTGHITMGGSVCTELLTPGGWVQTTSVMSLILMLKQNMYDGGARIDPTRLGKEYGFQEACDAYNRMLTTHAKDWGSKSQPKKRS